MANQKTSIESLEFETDHDVIDVCNVCSSYNDSEPISKCPATGLYCHLDRPINFEQYR